MSIRATYRLQFNRHFTFADAVAILPYLDSLGISHLYASPIAVAQPGSMHGYDVIDPTRINPELGGEAGFRALAAACRGRGMGIIVDIVPNHMSVTGGANRWWNDLLEKGEASDFASWFDIDWGAPILLPFLGEPLDQAIAGGALALERIDGRSWVRAYGRDLYPLRRDVAADAADLAALLGRQHYRLAWWRVAGDCLNWRRFFTISGLAGLRQEDEQVFEATHSLWLRLFAEGLIDGVRVDHVDGLADPAGYCRRLRARLESAPGRRAWIVVEKILGADEALPGDWGVDGTSGYDFMDQVSALLHAPEAAAPLGAHWAALSGRPDDFESEALQARRETLAWEFEGQLAACLRAFSALAAGAVDTAALTEAMLRRALEVLIAAFPVYRTYGGAADAPALARARAGALRLAPPGEEGVVDQLVAWLSGAGPGDPALREEALRRFRQLSAPIAAKAVEDTAFYRYGRLLSRNDVGFDPGLFSIPADAFHRAMRARAADWPRAMLATATHDHKRGEDVTARLAVLSALPETWIRTSNRWRAANAAASDGIAAADEYLLYQMLVGAWPVTLDPDRPGDREAFAARLWGWMEKALREAKLRSSWTAPDAQYEARCRAFLERLLDPARSRLFLDEARRFVGTIAPAGEAGSLVRTFLRCTAPGIPDCYQGCEYEDLSLVDPDNRRPADFVARAASLEAPPSDFDSVKQHLIARLLRLRRDHPLLWSDGGWERIEADGPRAANLLAFARRGGDSILVGAVVLHCAPELVEAKQRIPRREYWGETRFVGFGATPAADLFSRLPVHLSLEQAGRANRAR